MAAAPTAVTAAPTAPAWLPGQPMLAGTQVIAMWLPVPGAVKYFIYINGQKVMESPANQYIAPAPEAGGEYRMEIVAVDAAGAESPRSQPGVFQIIVVEPPKDLITRVDRAAKFILLRWDRSVGAIITNLYRATSPEGPFSLVASITDDTYKDSEVDYGKTYYYALSSKDVTGKESGRSKVFSEKMLEPDTAVRVTGPPLRVVPTRERDYIQYWPETEVSCIAYQFFQLGNELYSPQGNLLRVFDADNMRILRNLPIVRPEGFSAPYPPAFTRVFLTSDRDGVASDDQNNMVHFFDIGNDRVTLRASHKLRMIDPKQRQDLYEKVPLGQRGVVPTPIGVGTLADGTAIAFDVKAGVACLVDEKDGVIDWVYEYTLPDGTVKTFSAIVDAIPVEGGDLLLFSPSNRRIVRLDPNDMKAKWESGGDYSGIVGKFVGMGGATVRKGVITVSDPTLHTVQNFDVETGKYLYSFGDQSGKPDPKNGQRANTDFSFPNLPYLYPDGKTLYIALPMDKACSVRTVLDDDGAIRGKFADEAIKGAPATAKP